MQSGRKIDDEGESQRILARLAGETEAGSAVRVAAPKGQAAVPSPDDDPIEYWGTRIGRGLGLVITVVLIAWLVVFVVRGG